MFYVAVTIILTGGTLLLWCAWNEYQTAKHYREEAEALLSEIENAHVENTVRFRAVNERMQDLHRSLNKTCCGRETTWPE
jgi:hypothetical protein